MFSTCFSHLLHFKNIWLCLWLVCKSVALFRFLNEAANKGAKNVQNYIKCTFFYTFFTAYNKAASSTEKLTHFNNSAWTTACFSFWEITTIAPVFFLAFQNWIQAIEAFPCITGGCCWVLGLQLFTLEQFILHIPIPSALDIDDLSRPQMPMGPLCVSEGSGYEAASLCSRRGL